MSGDQNRRMRVLFLYLGSPQLLALEASGSSIRPNKMLAAFSQQDDVELVTIKGRLRYRCLAMLSLMFRFETFDLCYIEAPSAPSFVQFWIPGFFKSLGLPLSIPYVDPLKISFLCYLRLRGVAVGIFYRDVYWEFPETYAKISKSRLLFFKVNAFLDAILFRFIAKVIFVPTVEFTEYLPGPLRKAKSVALPPGAETKPIKAQGTELIYVGGCGPVYDPQLFLGALQDTKFSILFNTRRNEWQSYQELHSDLVDNLRGKLQVSHFTGGKLPDLYHQAAIGVIPQPPIGYFKICMPYKLLEYVSYGLPIIAFKGTPSAHFIEKHEIGWTVSFNEDSVRDLLQDLYTHPNKVEEARQKALALRETETWAARAQTACEALKV